MTRIGDGPLTLDAFVAALRPAGAVEMAPALRARLAAARAVVDAAAAGDAPVYGLNTGLGANLGHRIAAADIPAFQRQLIAGRAVATGAPLPEATGRAVLLARLASAASGHSGLSLPLFDHLCAVFAAGLSPLVPRHGSIGASDLTQNAVWALALLGEGRMWRGGEISDAAEALAGAGLVAPELQPKDAMALINHGGLTTALAAEALDRARTGLVLARAAALLSCAGYDANRDIFAADINALRPAPGQAEMAAWFAARLAGGGNPPRRVQDALSFRVLASVLGAARDAVARAVDVWTGEANGASDNPAVVGDQAMRSTPNFQAPALALALEGVALALTMAANGAVQRMQRLMNPDLTGLPRYLSPRGGASAGMVPLQKTAAALFADLRRHAQPVVFDPAPVSDGVEDMAPQTPAAARKLTELTEPFALLCGAEALVAAQAIDLRAGTALSATVARLHARLRAEIPPLDEDRPLGADIARAADLLRAEAPGLGED